MALALLVFFGFAPLAEAGARKFTTSGGALVQLDSVTQMECPALRQKLAEIDSTGYRGQNPTPSQAKDQPLFIYEHKVARALYTRCTRDLSGSEVSGVLRRGFRN